MSNSRLMVIIDAIERKKEDGLLIVQGWGIDTAQKEALEVKILSNPEIESVKIEQEYRGDVNATYQFPVKVNCGFYILIRLKSFTNTVTIVFRNGEIQKKLKLNMKKAYCHAMEKNNPRQKAFIMFQKGYKYIQKHGILETAKKIKHVYQEKNAQYQEWMKRNETLTKEDYDNQLAKNGYQPKISIILPVYNVESKWLNACVQSVKDQYYSNWELCIADDCSTLKSVKQDLEAIQNADDRIKVVFREENGHISKASNSALALATGEYVTFLDNDDTLAPNALSEVVNALNKEERWDILYSDEDKIDTNDKRQNPYFKSDWAPDSLMSGNYICHLCVYRKALIDQVGGLRAGYEGAQDHDLLLRTTEITEKIGHIPKILYHWRLLKSSTAQNVDSKGYAYQAGKKALADALQRRGLKGDVVDGAFPGLYNIHYAITEKHLVSIIIPTRDGAEDVKTCVDSILKKTTYPHYEIIIADNGSEKQETLDLFAAYTKNYPDKIKVVRIDIPFNYARINNLAVKEAQGDILLFLNNDTEVIADVWMERMLGYAQLEHVGAVGAKLYYLDETIQHAGVVLGMGGAAGHIHYNFPRHSNGYFGKLVSATNYLAVTGACLMVKRADFERVGGFTEEFTVAYNDVDLCIKLYESGRYNVWVAEAELYHFESKSRGYEDNPEKRERFAREIKMLQDKWLKYIKNDPFYNPNLTKMHADFSINLDD